MTHDEGTEGVRLLDAGKDLLPVPEEIERNDPVLRLVLKRAEEDLTGEDVAIPRPAAVSRKILAVAKDPNASARDVMRCLRLDPVLAGRLLEMANSAAYAGVESTFSLEMVVVRLGLNKIQETAESLPAAARMVEGRSTILNCQWKTSVATALACEVLAAEVPSIEAGAGYLTGLFHAAADPLIVHCVGQLESSGALEPQSAGRVLGIVSRLSGRVTIRVIRRWSAPKKVQEAVRLQSGRIRERRARPLAHLLLCGRALVAELGIGAPRLPVDFDVCRDFKFLKLDDEKQLAALRRNLADAVQDTLG